MNGIDIKKLQTLKEQLEEEQLNQYKETPIHRIIEKTKNKQKLAIQEQIEYMKFKGVTFFHATEDEARNYLIENSYYYKVTAYRKNFAKNGKNKYQHLDFANLKDLAIIDMHLRYVFLKLSLDIEHAIKTKLLKLITSSDEDGYSIVEEYNTYQYISIDRNERLSPQVKEKLKNNYVPSAQNILKDSKNPKGYHKDLFDKHNDNPSIWVLIELMSYGQLASFIKFYVEKETFGYKELTIASSFMHYSKNIRDSAAHSRPILLNIIEPMQIKKRQLRLKEYLYDASIKKTLAKKYLTNRKVHDLCSLLYLHDHYIKGSRARSERKKELKYVFRRAMKNKHLYLKSKDLGDVLLLFGVLLKNYKC